MKNQFQYVEIELFQKVEYIKENLEVDWAVHLSEDWIGLTFLVLHFEIFYHQLD